MQDDSVQKDSVSEDPCSRPSASGNPPDIVTGPQELTGAEASPVESGSPSSVAIPDPSVAVTEATVLLPGRVRRYGPMCFLACLAASLAPVGRPWALVQAALAGLLLGCVLYPAGRHRHRVLYRSVWSVWLAFFLIGGGLLGQIGVGVVMALRGYQSLSIASPGILIGSLLCTVAAAIVPVWIVSLKGDRLWVLGLHGTDLKRSVLLGVQAGLLFVGVDLISLKICQTLGLWEISDRGLAGILFQMEEPGQLLVGLVMLAGLVSVSEEILFRGVLFAALRRSKGPLSAVLLSAMFFGFCHTPEIVLPTLMGLIFATLYHITGSLWSSIAAHTVVNSAAVILSFNHGVLFETLPWPTLAAVLMGVGFLFLIRSPSRPAREELSCMCRNSRPMSQDRCPWCAYPFASTSPWFRWALRVSGAITLMSLGAGAFFVDRFAVSAYTHDRSEWALSVQYELLRGTGRMSAGERLLTAWTKDRPESHWPVRLLAFSAYKIGDYRRSAALVEAELRRVSEPETVRLFKNILSLNLAEEGGARAEEAVQLAKDALEGSTGRMRLGIEDTLGWALVRAGRCKEARQYLDRELSEYGTSTRDGVAELSYHRGVLLWALGDVVKARSVLEMAARVDTAGGAFGRRAREILTTGKLPAGLIPSNRPDRGVDEEP